METKEIIAKAIDVVVFLFAAFGGFLAWIAPPGQADSRFAVGLSSVITLLLLLLISVLVRQKLTQSYSYVFLTGAAVLVLVAIVSGLIYKSNLDQLTFPYTLENPPLSFVKGTELTAKAQDYKKDHPDISDADLVGAFGPPPNSIESVWTSDSILHARRVLILYYVIFVLAVAAAVFALSEGFLVKPSSSQTGSGKSD